MEIVCTPETYRRFKSSSLRQTKSTLSWGAFLFFEGRVCRISELSEVHASDVRKRLFISSPTSSAERRFVAQRQYIFSALSARFLAFFLCNILESLAFRRIICYTMQKDIYSTIDKCTTSTFWQWQGQVVSFSLKHGGYYEKNGTYRRNKSLS